MELEILFGILIFALVVILVAILIVLRPTQSKRGDLKELIMQSERRNQEMVYQMKQAMDENLHYFQNNLEQVLKQDLHTLNETTTQRLFSIEKNVNQNLSHGYEHTSKAFAQVVQQMGQLSESQKSLKELASSITHLQSILTDKKTRGIFGEIELYSLLENAMGVDQKRYAKQYKLSNGTFVDAVVFASEQLRMICIDSKFPLENYNRIMDETNNSVQKKKAHNVFVQDVKKHIKSISEKYILAHETAEFAFLFLPAEAVFAYLYATCEEVVRYSYEQKVYIVSPTTLMAYITAIKAIYIGQQRNENIIEIQKELTYLQVEFERFDKRYTNISHDFERCYQDMKLLHITAQKLTTRFQEIQEVNLIHQDEELELGEKV